MELNDFDILVLLHANQLIGNFLCQKSLTNTWSALQNDIFLAKQQFHYLIEFLFCNEWFVRVISKVVGSCGIQSLFTQIGAIGQEVAILVDVAASVLQFLNLSFITSSIDERSQSITHIGYASSICYLVYVVHTKLFFADVTDNTNGIYLHISTVSSILYLLGRSVLVTHVVNKRLFYIFC